MITASKVIVWLVIGALAGSFTGLIITGSKAGFGRWSNLALGLVGAVLGGSLFHLLGIDLGWAEIAVSLEDLVAAVVGAVLLLIIIQLIRIRRSSAKTT